MAVALAKGRHGSSVESVTEDRSDEDYHAGWEVVP